MGNVVEYRLDCKYIEQQRLRPYCHKLQKEIRPKNCFGCGWYSLAEPKEELGVGSMFPEDLKRLEDKINGGDRT